MEKNNNKTPAELLREYFLNESKETLDRNWNAVKDIKIDGPLIEDVIQHLNEAIETSIIDEFALLSEIEMDSLDFDIDLNIVEELFANESIEPIDLDNILSSQSEFSNLSNTFNSVENTFFNTQNSLLSENKEDHSAGNTRFAMAA